MTWEPLTETIDNVFPIPVLTRTLPPHRHTNSFLLGRRQMAMIDAGLWDDLGINSLLTFISQVKDRRLEWLFLTHWHPDHRMGVERIRKETGCKIGIHEAEAEPLAPLSMDILLQGGDRFSLDEMDLEVIHTPGHSPGHCCFLLSDHKVLFTGDHILGLGTSIIVPPDGDMAQYMHSLVSLLAYPISIICPGHGPIVWQAKEKVQEYITHRQEREAAILEGVHFGLKSPEELVKRVYTDIPESFHGMACFSVMAHLVKLEQEGRVRQTGQGYEAI